MSSLSHQQASNDKATENPNVNAEEQMETLSEGKVADAVEKKSGAQTAPGENVVFDDFSSDIGRKKAEQATARENVKDQKSQGVDVDGSLGLARRNEDITDV